MHRILMTVGLIAVLLGCGSSVKLDDVAVEDRKGTAVTAQPATVPPGTGGATAGSGAGTVGSSSIAPVAIGPAVASAAVPAGPRTVYFDYDSFEIKPEFQSMIDVQARYLRADSTRKAAIEGHTDERGGREYNLALGQKRAEALRRALTLLGVPDGQLEAVSFGKEKPAVAGSDEAALARNRRAEISYR